MATNEDETKTCPLMGMTCIGEACAWWVGLCAIPSIDFKLFELWEKKTEECVHEPEATDPPLDVEQTVDHFCEALGVPRIEADEMLYYAYDLFAIHHGDDPDSDCMAEVVEQVLAKYGTDDTRRAAVIGFLCILVFFLMPELTLSEVKKTGVFNQVPNQPSLSAALKAKDWLIPDPDGKHYMKVKSVNGVSSRGWLIKWDEFKFDRAE